MATSKKKVVKKTAAKKAVRKTTPKKATTTKRVVKKAAAKKVATKKTTTPGGVKGQQIVAKSKYTIKAVSREGQTGWVLMNNRKKTLAQSAETFASVGKALSNAKAFLRNHLNVNSKEVSIL